MTRKNIFQLVEENYNIQDEIRKINRLFFDENYFSDGYVDYTIEELLEEFLFVDWKYRETCLTVREFLKQAKALIDYRTKSNTSEEVIINNIEVMENLIKLYYDNSRSLKTRHQIDYYDNLEYVFYPLIETLEKRMGLVKKKFKDKIILYPKNAPLEQVINICEDEDVQWELIRYAREDMSLSEKRKSLAYFATNLYIEDDSSETDEHIKAFVEKATNILNNLQIRHNNKTGKWVNSVLEDITNKDAICLCDYAFSLMLTIVLLREQKQYDAAFKAFRDKQKEAKNKNKENK